MTEPGTYIVCINDQVGAFPVTGMIYNYDGGLHGLREGCRYTVKEIFPSISTKNGFSVSLSEITELLENAPLDELV